MRQDGGTEPAKPITGEPGDEPGLPAAPDSPDPLIDNRLFVLVLEPPPERTEPGATASLMIAALPRDWLVVGLSWPNLARALGRRAAPRRWGVLYLGSALPSVKPRDPAPPPERKPERPSRGAILALDRDGNPLPDADQGADRAANQVLRGLEGIVLLD